MGALVFVLFITAFFFDRARRAKNVRMMKMMIGIAAFCLAASINNFLYVYVYGYFLPEEQSIRTVASLSMAAACFWPFYQGLKIGLMPKDKSKEMKGTALDAELMQHEEPKE